MEPKRPGRTPEELERLLFQRFLQHLAALRPNAPMPLMFLCQVLTIEFLGEVQLPATQRNKQGPPRLEELIQKRSFLELPDVAVSTYYTVGWTSQARSTVTVDHTQFLELQKLLHKLQGSGQWLAARTQVKSELMLTSILYFKLEEHDAGLVDDDLALLAAHVLFWLEHLLVSPELAEAYQALHLYVVLWMIVVRRALAAAELIPWLPRVFAAIEQTGHLWYDTYSLEYAAALGAAMAESGAPGLEPWITRAFAFSEGVLRNVAPNVRSESSRVLQAARRRAGT